MMAHAFILIPDRLVGNPMTVFEAVRFWSSDRFPIKDQIRWTNSERRANIDQAHRALWLALATVELHAFVQSPEAGSWFRIPRGYWFEEADNMLDLIQSARIPDILERRVENTPLELLDRPIVFWREDVTASEAAIVKKAEDFLNAFLENARFASHHNETPKKIPIDPISSVTLNDDHAEERRIAAVLDAAGKAKRYLDKADVLAIWDGKGREPLAKVVRSYMTDKPRGRRPKGA